MQDLMSKLQSVLGDEQSMKQLSEIASALSSDQSSFWWDQHSRAYLSQDHTL